VLADLKPVSPLAAPARRALALALPALAGVGVATVVLLERGSPQAALSLAGGAVPLLQWLAGLGLLWLALREAVPALGVGAARAGLALTGSVVLQLGLGLLLWQSAGGPLPGTGGLAAGLQCATGVGALSLPHLAAAFWLALRALPLRPRWSGALAGAAAGLFADAIWHLACTLHDLEHLLVWHFGATLAMTLLGALSGSFFPHRSGVSRRAPAAR
jgi:hypothetical protein